MSRRFFTVAEVNGLLPRVKIAAELLKSGSRRLEALAEQLYESDKPDADTVVPPDYAEAVVALQSGVEAIQEIGGEVKDFRQGLVDFRSLKNGREVYLCWLPGEDRVAFWHELHAGFAGRTAITESDDFHGDLESRSS